MPVPKEAKELLKEQGVVGVSDPEAAIRVYVETEEDLAKLPETIAGMSVIGIVSGRFHALASRTDRWRPAPGGVSIGHYRITAGTLGCVVRDKKTGKRVILSNNHVLAFCNFGKIGDPILQPGRYDGGTLNDTIAKLTRFVEIKRPPRTNLVDAAIATPLSDDMVTEEILEIGKIAGINTDVKIGDVLKKSGRSSGLTSAEVIDTSATIKVYGYPFGYAIFEDQIITKRLGIPGDSGSAVLDEKNRIAGLLFAGSFKLTAVNKIQHVFDLLDVTVPEHRYAGINILPLLLLGGAYYVYRKLRKG